MGNELVERLNAGAEAICGKSGSIRAADLRQAEQEEEIERLREAVDWFVRNGDHLETDIKSAHLSRGCGASDWMREDDRDFRSDLKCALDKARTALSPGGEG